MIQKLVREIIQPGIIHNISWDGDHLLSEEILSIRMLPTLTLCLFTGKEGCLLKNCPTSAMPSSKNHTIKIDLFT